MEIGPTYSLGLAFFFGLPKTISPQSFLAISPIFSNCFISFLKLTYRRKSLKERRRINKRRKWWTSFWTPRLQKKNIWKILLFILSHLLFFFWILYFSLHCCCNFSTKVFFAFILETKNDRNLFVENKNEEVFCVCHLLKHNHLVSWNDVSLFAL
jgi:hypothetical protein